MANAYGPYSTSNTLGVNFKETAPAENITTFPLTPYPPFALGTPVLGTDNSTWVYIQADVPIPANSTAVTVNANFHATAATGGTYTAVVAFLANDFGWVKKTASPL